MNISLHKSNVRTIRDSDPDFKIVDGFVVYPRAMLYVTPGAPANVQQTLDWAIAQGYIRCVAHVTDRELMWDRLSE
jgi:hypothetical protein